jgi:hypothetical protein
MSLSKIKKTNSIERLNAELTKLNNKPTFTKQNDERFWRAEQDTAGNGYAEIRFLPAPPQDGDDALPWVRVYNHGFHGPAGEKGPWYIENSLTTINQKDPVSEYNSKLWKSGTKENKEFVSKNTKRRLTYYSNILVVSDPKNPDNEGRVFLFKYGKRIFDKLTEAMNPKFPDEAPVNPFDPLVGANFKLKIQKVDGYANYNASKFLDPKPIFDDEDKIEELMDKEYSLLEFIDPKNFKSYTELKEKMEKVLQLDQEADDEPAPKASTKTTQAITKGVEEVVLPDDEDDDVMSRFAKLTED